MKAMSLLDFAPPAGAPVEATEEVRLHLRLSGGRAIISFLLISLFAISFSTFAALVLIDPQNDLARRPVAYPHSLGAALVELVLSLPLPIRAPLLWSLAVAIGLAVLACARRLSDHRVDYVIGRRGVTDIGLFRARHLDWSEVRRVVLFTQRQRTRWFRSRIEPGAHFVAFDTGIDPDVYGPVQRASYNLFVRKRIAIPLGGVGIDAAEMERIVRRFQPTIPIAEEVRYFGL